jgi:hypothetical protein
VSSFYIPFVPRVFHSNMYIVRYAYGGPHDVSKICSLVFSSTSRHCRLIITKTGTRGHIFVKPFNFKFHENSRVVTRA